MASNRQDSLRPRAAVRTEERRGARRELTIGLRKEKRAKLHGMKRLRHDDDDDTSMEGDETDIPDSVIQEKFTAFVGAVLGSKNDKDFDTVIRDARRLLARGSRLVDIFLKVEHAMDALSALLQKPAMQLEACWCVSNIAASIPEHTQAAMVTAPMLVVMLENSSQLLQDQAAWALGNMAGDGPECRDAILAHGVSSHIIRLIGSSSVNVMKASAFLLSNLIRGVGADTSVFLSMGILTIIMEAFKREDLDGAAIAELYWCLVYLTANNISAVTVLLENSCLQYATQHVVYATTNNDLQCVSPLLRVLGNIASGPDEFVNAMLSQEGLMPALVVFLQSPQRHLKLECAWMLSNVAGGTRDQAKYLVDLGIVPHFIAMLDETPDLQKEAMHAINRMAQRGEDILEIIIATNPLPRMLKFLKFPDIEGKHMVLHFIDFLCKTHPQGADIVQSAQGIEYLEAQLYGDDEVQSLTYYQETENWIVGNTAGCGGHYGCLL
eukprot:m.27508 g.27508  ORF g.27508 m.27508 type:complete len:495 (-) comp7902_c0_seq2:155-1639(-)